MYNSCYNTFSSSIDRQLCMLILLNSNKLKRIAILGILFIIILTHLRYASTNTLNKGFSKIRYSFDRNINFKAPSDTLKGAQNGSLHFSSCLQRTES
jgi:hypothetical protein